MTDTQDQTAEIQDVERKLKDERRAEAEEATRMLRAIRTIREQGLSCGNSNGRWSVAAGGLVEFGESGGLVGYGDSPAEALFHYHNARDSKPHQPYPGYSYSLRDMPYVERMQWLVHMKENDIERLQQELEQLRSLRVDGAIRVSERDVFEVELDQLSEEQQLVMTVDTFRQFVMTYESPEKEKRRRERLEAAFPGPRQYTGPEPSLGLPRYYRLDRRTYESADGTPWAHWSPGAIDPGDDESMGFCGYDTPEAAAAECRRHAEHVRGDETGVQLTPQWSASTIESFWYRWCENREGDSTKLTTADFVRDLCAAVKKP